VGDAERSTAGGIVDLASRLELGLHVVELDVRDPWDLLHPDAIRLHALRSGDRPTFPGHDQAHELHDGEPDAGKSAYGEFLYVRYGIGPDARILDDIAETMAQHGLPASPPLADALWRVAQITMTAEVQGSRPPEPLFDASTEDPSG
jgi:hypothetical protein